MTRRDAIPYIWRMNTNRTTAPRPSMLNRYWELDPKKRNLADRLINSMASHGTVNVTTIHRGGVTTHTVRCGVSEWDQAVIDAADD